MTAEDTALLTIRGLRIAFPAGRAAVTEVVHGIDLTVARGQVVALVGESGSGKSVTALSVLRLLAPDVRVEGSIVFDGVDLSTADAATIRSVRGARIGAVFQEPMGAWNPVQTIGRQITEALQTHGGSGDHTARVRGLLSASGLDDPDRVAASYPHQLSGGQLQRAMVAMATGHDPDLLIADEPTTALDVTVQAGVLDLLRELAAERDTAVLLITHDMGVVADLADEVVVLRDGQVVEHGPAARVLTDPREDYTRTLLAAVPTLDASGASSLVKEVPSPVVARLRGVEVVYPGQRAGVWRGTDAVHAVDAVDLDLHAGRTLGLVGESGSGKSTLGRCLTGLVRPDAGSVEVDGTDLSTLSGARLRQRQRQVGIVFQDPGSSLNPKHDVAHSVSEPLRLAGCDRARIATRRDELFDAVHLERGLAQRYPHQLSGGQRQRVAVARALALSPTLLVADEPTSALDVSVQAHVLELIVELQRELGFACLFISHDLAVVGAVAHEVAVMRSGRIVEHGPAAAVLSAPTDDYTIRLLAAAPVADPDEQRKRRERRRQLV